MSYKYISVTKAPASGSDSLTFKFRQLNNSTSVPFTILVAGLLSTMTEGEVASTIQTAFETYFAAHALSYSKQPSFTRDGAPPFTFVSVNCDHIINVWSQAAFELKLVANVDSTVPTVVTNISDSPIFPTVADALAIGPSYGVIFKDNTGTDLSPALITELLKVGSNQVISWLGGFKIAASTYLQEVHGFYQLGFQFDKAPLIQGMEDGLCGRIPGFPGNAAGETFPLADYEIDYRLGSLEFPDNGPYRRTLLNPLNFCKMTYVAGYPNVPDIVKEVTVQVLTYVKINVAVESLKQGVFQIRYRDLQAIRLDMSRTINQALDR